MRPLPEVGVVGTDKLLHTLAFGALAVLLVLASLPFRVGVPTAPSACAAPSARTGRKITALDPRKQRLIFGLYGASALGALLEVCQAFVPYRSSDALDWFADTLGAALAMAALSLVLRFTAPNALSNTPHSAPRNSDD